MMFSNIWDITERKKENILCSANKHLRVSESAIAFITLVQYMVMSLPKKSFTDTSPKKGLATMLRPHRENGPKKNFKKTFFSLNLCIYNMCIFTINSKVVAFSSLGISQK